MYRKTVMITGCAGNVGRISLEFLARTPGVGRIIASDLNEERGLCIASNAILSAALSNCYPKIEFLRLDLRDEEQTTTAIKKIKPDVILNTATMYTSYYYYEPLLKIIKKLGVKFHRPAHTIAKDIFLIYKLMKAVKNSEADTHVINVAFPDNTHPALKKVGLAPTTGVGNAVELVVGFRRIVAKRLNVSMRNVSVSVIAHHAITVNKPGIVPYYTKIKYLDEDITNQFNTDELIGEVQDQLLGKDRTEMELVNALVGAHAVRIISAILNDTDELLHAPGIDGMAGCLPARFNSDGAKIVLPSDITMEEIQKMFSEGLKIDGIERIENDGTIVFTEDAVRILEEGLGLKGWKTLKLSDAEQMSNELISAYKRIGMN